MAKAHGDIEVKGTSLAEQAMAAKDAVSNTAYARMLRYVHAAGRPELLGDIRNACIQAAQDHGNDPDAMRDAIRHGITEVMNKKMGKGEAAEKFKREINTFARDFSKDEAAQGYFKMLAKVRESSPQERAKLEKDIQKQFEKESDAASASTSAQKRAYAKKYGYRAGLAVFCPIVLPFKAIGAIKDGAKGLWDWYKGLGHDEDGERTLIGTAQQIALPPAVALGLVALEQETGALSITADILSEVGGVAIDQAISPMLQPLLGMLASMNPIGLAALACAAVLVGIGCYKGYQKASEECKEADRAAAPQQRQAMNAATEKKDHALDELQAKEQDKAKARKELNGQDAAMSEIKGKDGLEEVQAGRAIGRELRASLSSPEKDHLHIVARSGGADEGSVRKGLKKASNAQGAERVDSPAALPAANKQRQQGQAAGAGAS